ncbi:MAG: PAS domain S-box protein [Bacteroidetes bacterium]|nr:PAS domain S-box protein [Bacteroidota bacterium]
MNEQAAVRRGIPLNLLVGRMLIPAAFIIVAGTILLSVFMYRSIQKNAVADVLAAVKTVYETHPAVHGESNGLAVLSNSFDYERFWILSATGDILASSRKQEIGSRLDRVWWKYLEGRSSGIVLEDVPFGSRTLLMAGVYESDRGRWAVAISDSRATLASWLWPITAILILGLMVMGSLGAIAWITLRRNVARPLQQLNETTTELLRGSTISDATLDRLWAETEHSLGGHADSVVDLARRYIVTVKRGEESEERFRRLFDSLEGLAFIRSRDARIMAVNTQLKTRLGFSREWILGNSVHILAKAVPVAALEEWLKKATSSAIGIQRLEVFPGEMAGVRDPIRISALPIRFQGVDSHLILVEPVLSEYPSTSEIRTTSDETDCGGETLESRATDAPTSMSNTLHSAILRTSEDMVLVLDEQTRIVYWSSAAARLTGWKADDMDTIGTFVKKALSTIARKRFEEWLDDDPTDRTLQLSINTARGEELSTRWKASLVKLDDGSSYGILMGREFRAGDFSADRPEEQLTTSPATDGAGG